MPLSLKRKSQKTVYIELSMSFHYLDTVFIGFAVSPFPDPAEATAEEEQDEETQHHQQDNQPPKAVVRGLVDDGLKDDLVDGRDHVAGVGVQIGLGHVENGEAVVGVEDVFRRGCIWKLRQIDFLFLL